MSYLLIYGLVLSSILFLREAGRRSSLLSFVVADRQVGGFFGATSIAASWIWAPAIFVSTMAGFRWGYSGLIWFIVPNMLALVVFAPLAQRVRQRVPDGMSYIDYCKTFDGSFWKMQLALHLGLQVIIYSIQLTAGANMLQLFTGASYSSAVIGMALVPLFYTLRAGLRASVFTDCLQYLVILVGALTLLSQFQPTAPVSLPNFEPLRSDVMWGFGISSAMSLIVAIFADQQQWQRAFACREGTIIPTFVSAGLLHGLVTLTLGSLGVLIAATGFQPTSLQYVGVEFVQAHYMPWAHMVFVAMALCALISTLDSGLCAFSSMCSAHLLSGENTVRRNRLSMLVLIGLAVSITLFRFELLTLWFLAGAVRLSSFVPTVASILQRRFDPRAGMLAVFVALIIGVPIFAIGCYRDDAIMRTVGMLCGFAVSGIVLLSARQFMPGAASQRFAFRPKRCTDVPS